MCASLWPGLVNEGPPFCQDLTAPPVYLQTLSTPCGTMGAVIPLGITLLYISSIDLSAGGEQEQTFFFSLAGPHYCNCCRCLV